MSEHSEEFTSANIPDDLREVITLNGLEGACWSFLRFCKHFILSVFSDIFGQRSARNIREGLFTRLRVSLHVSLFFKDF